jgi:hypothetical protein
MRNATLYDGWEPSRPEVNGRSYLVHLPPSESIQRQLRASPDILHVWPRPMLSKRGFSSIANCCPAFRVREVYRRGRFP